MLFSGALLCLSLSLMDQTAAQTPTAAAAPPPGSLELGADGMGTDEDIFNAVDELVSTASRANDPIRLAPASITVVHRQEIDDFAYTTLQDALSGTRGFFSSSDLTNATLGMRGVQPFGSLTNRVQLQLDGHILNEDWQGQAFVGFDLLSSLDGLERIEAVRGPGSVLFGTGAMLGVVNLVTPNVAPTTLATGGVSVITPGTARFHVVAGESLGDNDGVWIAVGGVAGAPFDLELPSYRGTPWAPTGVARDVGALEAGSFLGKLWVGDLTLEMYAAQQQTQLAAANYGTTFGDQRTREDVNRGFIELRYEPKLSDTVQLLTRAYVDGSSFFGLYPYTDPEYGVGRETFQSISGGVEARTILTMIDTLRIAAGLELKTHPHPDTYGEASLPEPTAYINEVHPFHRGSLYANADWDPATWLRVSGGLRFDAWLFEELGSPEAPTGARFIPSLNPRLAVIWMPSDLDTLKLLAGTAFRVPSILELTYNDGDYTQQRSPDVDPETIYTAELEYSREVTPTVKTIASVYTSILVGLVQQVGSGEEGDLLRYINEEDPTWVTGAELALEKSLSDDLFIAASSTWALARRSDPFAGERLENAPDFLVGAKAAWHGLGPAAHLSTRLQVETPRLDREGNESSGAVLWDATLSGAVEVLQMDYGLSLRNILDAQVTQPVGGDIAELTLLQPGRALMAQVRFHL